MKEIFINVINSMAYYINNAFTEVSIIFFVYTYAKRASYFVIDRCKLESSVS